jgi:hypothetical protein
MACPFIVVVLVYGVKPPEQAKAISMPLRRDHLSYKYNSLIYIRIFKISDRPPNHSIVAQGCSS